MTTLLFIQIVLSLSVLGLGVAWYLDHLGKRYRSYKSEFGIVWQATIVVCAVVLIFTFLI